MVQQTRVNNHLNNLCISNYFTSEVGTSAALSIVYKRIVNLSRYVPPSHPDDAYKMEFLRISAIGNEWATESLSRISTSKLSYQEMYAELEIAV